MVKKITPVHFKIAYAVSDSLNIADNPTALETLHVMIPTQLPIEERKAALGPPIIDCRKTIATPWPGTITNKVVATIKDGRLFNSSDIFKLVGV
jgi:hypothetical protein